MNAAIDSLDNVYRKAYDEICHRGGCSFLAVGKTRLIYTGNVKMLMAKGESLESLVIENDLRNEGNG